LVRAPQVRADGGFAALLVLFGPDDFHTECIAMPGKMTAIDIVRESSLGVIISAEADADEAVCSIDGTGCNYPDEGCYCQCGSETCNLWTDYYWDGDEWQVSFDTADRVIPDGGIEAWVWGDGLTDPPVVSFGDICTGVVEPTGAPSTPAVQAASGTAYPESAATSTPRPTSTLVRPTITQGATSTRSAGQATVALATSSATRKTTPTRRPSPTQIGALASATASTVTPIPPSAGDAEAIAVSQAAPEGSPSADQAAEIIGTAAARSRATALAQQSHAEAQGPRHGWLIALGVVMAIAIGYAVLLGRQRQMSRPEAPSLPAAGAQPPTQEPPGPAEDQPSDR